MSPSVYPIYDTLPEASEHLRLLKVHAGGVSEPIRCTLQTVSFSDEPFYEALSYTWGDSSVTIPIDVDGFEIQVTANLEQALRHLREVETDLTLWVDAVCINQSDALEKSHQVALMGRMYRECDQVRIWLGCDSAKCRLAQSSLQPSNSADGSSREGDPFGFVRYLASDRHIRDLPCFHTRSDNGPDTIVYKANDGFEIISEAFIAVAESPWLTRMWTVQEAILPQKGLMTYDIWSTSLQTITDYGANCAHHLTGCCWEAVMELPIELHDAIRLLFNSTIILHSGRIRNNDGNVELDNLLWQHMNYGLRKCADPRDKVYGLLGIVNVMFLKPDYTLPVNEVFFRATCHMLCHEKGTLRSLTGPMYGPASGKWASWACQFDAPLDHREMNYAGTRYTLYMLGIFDASDSHESKHVLLMNQSPSRSCKRNQMGLEVKGRRVGTVTLVSQETFSDYSRERIVFRLWAQDALKCDDIDALADTYAYDDTSGHVSKYPDSFQSFLRTLLGGVDMLPNPASRIVDWNRFTPASMYWLGSFLSFLKDGTALNSTLSDLTSVSTNGRCYFKANDDNQGLCYPNASVGDEVWVLDGGQVPFILRPTSLDQEERESLKPLNEHAFMNDGTFKIREDCQPAKAPEGYYEFIGDCYFDGFMHGEAMHNPAFADQTIVLV